MNWHDVLLWFGPAFAWVALWTQFATIRFFDKNESLFKDLVGSGARDLALSSIETGKLIPALARLCDAAAATKAAKEAEELKRISTEDVLTAVDFLVELADAESAMSEMKMIKDLFPRLQQCASGVWKISLLHSFAIVLLPTAFLIERGLAHWVLFLLAATVASGSFVWLLVQVIRYQQMRDSLLSALAANRTIA